MARAIFYCHECQERLDSNDLETNRAFHLGENILCLKCVKAALSSLPPKAREAFKRKLRQHASVVEREAVPSRPAKPLPAPPPEEEVVVRDVPRHLITVLAGAGGLIVLIVVLLLVLGGGGDDDGAASSSVSPEGGAAEEGDAQPPPSVRDALEYARRVPDDLGGRLERYEKALGDPKAASFHGRIRADRDRVLKRLELVFNTEFAELKEQARGPYGTEFFGEAIGIWEQAKDRHAAPSWNGRIEVEIAEIRRRVEMIFPGIKGEAERAHSSGNKEGVRRVHERVAHWGLPERLKELEEAVGKPAPEEEEPPGEVAEPEPVAGSGERTEEGKAYLEAWERAMSHATARDYEKAISRIEEAGGNLEEEATRAEQAADLGDLRSLIALHEKGRSALAKLSKGKKVALKYRDPDGNDAEAEGTVVAAGSARIEILKEGESLFIEYEDLKASAVVETLLELKSRESVLLCLLEGEAEAAERITLWDLPSKYRDYAPKAIGNAAAPDPDKRRRELFARKLFYEAEVEFRDLETRGGAVGKYKTLVDDYATTRIVQEDLERLKELAVSCREYLFGAAAIRGSGSFTRSQADTVGACWLSALEEGADSQGNHVEVEFCALKGTKYLAWVQAGGCCTETFTFTLQGTDMVMINPRDRKEYSAEPDGFAAVSVKITSIRSLRRRHTDHAGRKDPTPKQPERWEWIPLKLPDYSAPGLKKIRLISSQPGFAVARLYVSSSAEAPPKDEELAQMKEVEGVAPAAIPQAGGDGLVAHWTFDAGDAVDATGNGLNGKLSGDLQKAKGKLGGALEFKDKSTSIEVADSPAFKLSGEFTIAFWLKYTSCGKGSYDMLRKGASQKDSSYSCKVQEAKNGTCRLFFFQGIEAGDPVKVFGAVPPDTWVHVAVVMKGDTLDLFLKGKSFRNATRAAAPVTNDIPLTIGGGFKGVLDDLRIYQRALDREEINALSRQ